MTTRLDDIRRRQAKRKRFLGAGNRQEVEDIEYLLGIVDKYLVVMDDLLDVANDDSANPDLRFAYAKSVGKLREAIK